MRLWTILVMTLAAAAWAGDLQAPPVPQGTPLHWKLPGEPDGVWRERRLWDYTKYEVIAVGGVDVVQATCKASASGRYYELTEPLPVQGVTLSWSWLAQEFPRGENLRETGGDDRAAAVVAVYKKSPLPWKARAIFYVWSAVLPMGTILPNPYAADVRVIVLRTGPSPEWQLETRDLAQDYRDVFGEAPLPLQAIGLLTDSDNTGSQARALYGPIALSTE